MNYELVELGSMGKALDIHKELAKEANTIHFDVTRRKEHDSEVVTHFIYLYNLISV